MRQVKVCFALLLILSQVGCSVIYSNYGYGKLAASKRIDGKAATSIVMPPNAPSISQRYRPAGIADPRGGHNGIDLFIPVGTSVLAAADGVVSRVSISVLYGNQVLIDHGKVAQGRQLQTRYFHLDEPLVRENQIVKRGEQIGLSGLSGMAAGFPHLHFEVHEINYAGASSNRVLDPQMHWANGVGQITCFTEELFLPETPEFLTYPAPCR